MQHVKPNAIFPKSLAALAALTPALSRAHVKWFEEYDVSAAPMHLGSVIGNSLFLALLALSACAVFAVIAIDNRLAPRSFIKTLDEMGARHVSRFLRYALALFFVMLPLADMQVILTPELETESRFILMLQLAIAGFALFNATAVLSGLGLLVLYAVAVAEYGPFHLLDYTVFIGIALFLVIESLRPGKHTHAALMTLRVTTSFTLLWGAVEKFAYPENFYRLLDQYPQLSFGFDQTFFVMCAGFVEFVCAYLILFGRLSSKVCVLVLLGFFVLAVIPFGMVDAIGHWMFAISLLALLATRNGFEVKVRPRFNTGMYLGGMSAMFACYYGAQFALT